MSDYIKREDALKIVNDMTEDEDDYKRCYYMIKDLPSADVVRVVRCKDCKHHEELLNNNDGNVLCWVHGLDVIVDRNGYCNYGEREE